MRMTMTFIEKDKETTYISDFKIAARDENSYFEKIRTKLSVEMEE